MGDGDIDNNQMVDGRVRAEESPPRLVAPAALDLHMPAVCAALVLVIQCIVSILLCEDVETNTQIESDHEGDNAIHTANFTMNLFFLSSTGTQGRMGILESLIGEETSSVCHASVASSIP